MSISLEDFVKFRNPPGCGEIIQLMQRNRRIKEEAATQLQAEELTRAADVQANHKTNAGGAGSGRSFAAFSTRAGAFGVLDSPRCLGALE